MVTRYKFRGTLYKVENDRGILSHLKSAYAVEKYVSGREDIDSLMVRYMYSDDAGVGECVEPVTEFIQRYHEGRILP